MVRREVVVREVAESRVHLQLFVQRHRDSHDHATEQLRARAPGVDDAAAQPDGTHVVRTAAVDIGTGARTTLTLIAADALNTTPDRIIMEIGHSEYPTAPLAGGSTGTGSWGWVDGRVKDG